MPDKLILNIEGNQGAVFIECDGIRKQLKKVKAITIRAGCDGVNEADLTMYTFDLASEVQITRANADAILAVEYGRQLSFLDHKDAGYLHELRATLVQVRGWPEDDLRLRPLDKILSELAKREEIPF
jgi:hypothetical protein